MSKVHHITFATGNSRVTGLPYSITQKLLIDSIGTKTKRKVISHEYDLESFKKINSFNKISNFPNINIEWKRDGYFCAYKALLAKEILEKVDEGDLIYYTDSSAYFKEPFTEDLDLFFDFVDWNGNICGSHGNDFTHNSFDCFTNTDVWNYIWPDSSKYLPNLLDQKHILASWYCLKNTEINRKFINEYSDLITDGYIKNRPIVTMHHTVDQSIFNALVYKYKFNVFYNDTHHDFNKNHNNVHRFINSLNVKKIEELLPFFPKPINYCQ
jgi:hypothetical protein